MEGIIQNYFPLRGYGYIHTEKHFRKGIFFHVSNWRGTEVPSRGQKVEFDLGSAHKPGQEPQAIKIIVIKDGVQ